MALKKRCIGCGFQFDFVAGEMFICPYCGTEQNPGLSVDHTDVLRNALNLRRTKDFEKARSEYKRVLEASPEMAEAHYGLFLCDFEITDETEIEDSEKFRAFESSYMYSRSYSVETNEHYKNAMNYFSEKEKSKWSAIADKIETCRKNNVKVSKVIKKDMFRIGILCDESCEADKELGDALYDKLKDRVDVFYAPITLAEVPTSVVDRLTLIAMKNISKQLYAIYSEETTDSKYLEKYCEAFMDAHGGGSSLYAVTERDENLPLELDCNADLMDYDADDISGILNEIRLRGGLKIQEMVDFKEGRHVVNDAMNPSPIIEWD